jgi:hypothetical protein
MRKIALIFAIVGLVVGVAYASLDELLEQYGTDKASKSNEESSASLKEISKKEYREEAEIIKIMSEARAEVDAEFQEQTEQTNKSLIVAVFSSIPDVIWAAIIASGLTLSGVYLSNRGNRRCLLVQLRHAAQEKDKERELHIRKEVYMEAAEAIAESIEDIQRLPNRIIHTNNLEICNKLLQAVAKVHMVGTLDTVKNTDQFMEKFNQSTLPIVPEITKFAVLKQELVNLNNLSEIQINIMKEINKNFEQMDSSSKQNPDSLEIYKETFQGIKTKHDTTVASMVEKGDELKPLQTKLLSMCLKAGIYLQKESLYVILSIRKELNLEIDSAEYISEMEEMFKKYDDFFTQENIEKLIGG